MLCMFFCFLSMSACVREPQLHSVKTQRGALWPSVCAPSPTKHGGLTSPLSECETSPPPYSLYFVGTGDNSLKRQEIAP